MSEKKVKKVRKKVKKIKSKTTEENGELNLVKIMKEMDGFEANVLNPKDKDTYAYILPFRNVALNKITGGIPSGVMVEISGVSQAGKSYLLYELMAECENQGGVSYLVDPEVAYRAAYGRRVGITKPFAQSKEPDIELMYKDFRKFVKKVRAVNSTCPILLGIDSYNNLSTKVDMANAEAGKDPRGYQAKIKNLKMQEGLKDFLMFIHKHDVVFIVLNPAKKDSSQEKPKFGPHPLSTLAENVIGFPSTIRIQGRIIKKLTVKVPSLNSAGETKKQVGAGTVWEVIKNRLIEPFKKASVDIIYARGCLKYSGLLEILCNEEKIKMAKRKMKKTDGTEGKKEEKGFRVCTKFEKEELKNKFYKKVKTILKDYPEFTTPEFSDDFFVAGTTEEEEIDIRKLDFNAGEDNDEGIKYESDEVECDIDAAPTKIVKKTKKKKVKK